MTLLLSILVFLTACNQPVNQTDPASDSSSDTVSSESADADNASQSQTVDEIEIVKTGQHECWFEELSKEVDEDGTQYRYGNLVFNIFFNDETFLGELPMILITDPDGSVRYETEPRWMSMTHKWRSYENEAIPQWYAEVICPTIVTAYSGEEEMLMFEVLICNDEFERLMFNGYVEFVPSEL